MDNLKNSHFPRVIQIKASVRKGCCLAQERLRRSGPKERDLLIIAAVSVPSQLLSSTCHLWSMQLQADLNFIRVQISTEDSFQPFKLTCWTWFKLSHRAWRFVHFLLKRMDSRIPAHSELIQSNCGHAPLYFYLCEDVPSVLSNTSPEPPPSQLKMTLT